MLYHIDVPLFVKCSNYISTVEVKLTTKPNLIALCPRDILLPTAMVTVSYLTTAMQYFECIIQDNFI